MRSFVILRENKRYIWGMSLLFLVGLFMGIAFHNGLRELLNPQLENIRHVANDINEKHNAFYTTFRIFANNLEVGAVFVPLFGIALGLFPMYMIVVNGLIVGYVMVGLALAKHLSIFQVFLFGVLPHGILEVPAFIFSAAMATKLGFVVVRPLQGMSRAQSIQVTYKEYVPVLGLVVVMLAIAACIEGNITPILVRLFLA
jgi:stage II sporulation protein M